MQRELLDYLNPAFPTRQNLNIFDLVRIRDRGDTESYSFSLTSLDTDGSRIDRFILRIYPDHEAMRKSAWRHKLMKRLHELGFPAPEVALEVEDSALFNRPFVIVESSAGRLLGPVLLDTSPERQRALLTHFCQLLVDLHRLDWKRFVPDPLPQTESGSTAVWQEMEEIQVYCHAINQPDFDPVIDWLRSHSSQVQPERLALIHGDYHPWNISLRDEDRALVLGWDGARISDYRVDLAWTLILADTYATPQVRDFMLNEYERLANHQVEQMDYFNVAASLKRLFVIIASTTTWSNTAEMQSRAEALAEQDGDHIRAVYTLLQEKTGLTVPVIERLLQALN